MVEKLFTQEFSAFFVRSSLLSGDVLALLATYLYFIGHGFREITLNDLASCMRFCLVVC